MVTSIRLAALLLCLGLAVAARAQQVEAFLDRTSVFAGETVLLTVEVTGNVDGETPDVGQLTRDFEILSSRREQQLAQVDGEQRNRIRWLFELAPKRIGDLTLPAMGIGPGLTTPTLDLTVLPLPENRQRDVFIEVAAEPRDPYVQSQVRYSERIFLGTGLRDNTISRSAPISGAVVQPLGDFREYVAQRDGRNYRVYERSLALFPEASGTLQLPTLTLRGRTVPDSQSLSRGRLVEATSELVTLQVRPRPAGVSGDHWLPSPELTLTESWPQDPPEFRVGEPITRSLVVAARGLDAVQLPELTPVDPDWANVYPDQPVLETRHDDGWLYGRREQRLAIVPTREGAFTLPAIRLVWWDTRADRERVAEIPARQVTILPAAGPAPAPPPTTEPATTTAPGEPAVPTSGWRWLSAGLLALWLSTLLGWWHDRRRHRPARPEPSAGLGVNDPKPRQTLRSACRADDPQRAARALLEWAVQEWPQRPPTSLGALATRAPHAAPFILALDRALYAPHPGAWHGDELWQALQAGLRPREAAPAPADTLPPLYPRRV